MFLIQSWISPDLWWVREEDPTFHKRALWAVKDGDVKTYLYRALYPFSLLMPNKNYQCVSCNLSCRQWATILAANRLKPSQTKSGYLELHSQSPYTGTKATQKASKMLRKAHFDWVHFFGWTLELRYMCRKSRKVRKLTSVEISKLIHHLLLFLHRFAALEKRNRDLEFEKKLRDYQAAKLAENCRSLTPKPEVLMGANSEPLPGGFAVVSNSKKPFSEWVAIFFYSHT